MNINELRGLIEGTVIDLLYTNSEVQELVVEILKNNPEILAEAIGPKKPKIQKEPANAELYDNLLLIAQGKVSKMNHEGKVVSAPNYGVGFKSGGKIKEWANKAYSKLGGEWDASANKGEFNQARRSDTMSFLSMVDDDQQQQGGDGGSGAAIRAAAASGDDHVLREQIANAGNGQMMVLTEDGQFDGEHSMDISDILMDTAKTTLKGFPSSHGDGSGNNAVQPADRAAAIVADSTPEEMFGADAQSWAAVAFSGMNIKD